MVNAYDVPADLLIKRLAEHMKKLSEIEVPEWARYVKTGSHRERPPQNPDWWYVRAASILRKLYFHGPLGIHDFEGEYGGPKQVGYNPKHHRDAGSSSIRKILHQLEQAELVSKTPKGRVLSPKGVSLLDKMSFEIFQELTKQNEALMRYG